MGRPQPRIARDRHEKVPPGRSTRHTSWTQASVEEMLEHVIGDHEVEAAIGERDRCGIRAYDVEAAFPPDAGAPTRIERAMTSHPAAASTRELCRRRPRCRGRGRAGVRQWSGSEMAPLGIPPVGPRVRVSLQDPGGFHQTSGRARRPRRSTCRRGFGRAIGPRACSFCGDPDLGAEAELSPPSVKRVEALTMTAAASTRRSSGERPRGSPVTIASGVAGAIGPGHGRGRRRASRRPRTDISRRGTAAKSRRWHRHTARRGPVAMALARASVWRTTPAPARSVSALGGSRRRPRRNEGDWRRCRRPGAESGVERDRASALSRSAARSTGAVTAVADPGPRSRGRSS